MLTNSEFEQLMIEQGRPEAGIKLIAKARKEAPVRQVKSTGKNVITMLASRKMGRSIATESRKVEYVAAIEHELNPNVLEYYPQPGTYKLEAINHVTGEVYAFEHTPDFLLIRKDCVKLQEWKTEDKLASLALKYPWRYQNIGGQWRSPQIEEHFAELGIQYEIHSAASIHPNRTKNWEILFDYFDEETPAPTESTKQRLIAALQNHGSLSLKDLQSKPFTFNADDLLKCIADGHLACDLDVALLSDLYNFRVYRDSQLIEFEKTLTNGCASESTYDFAVTLAPGARFQFDGRLLEIVVVGEIDIVFNLVDDGTTRTLSKSWLLTSVKGGKLKQVGGIEEDRATPSLEPLLVYTKEELQEAQSKAQFLAMPFDPKTTPFSERTYYRLNSLMRAAAMNGGHEVLALAPNNFKKGNRSSRLSDEQKEAMQHVFDESYKTNTSKYVSHVHRELEVYCLKNKVTCPSLPTFIKFVKALEDRSSRLIRGGSRIAYQEDQFYFHLNYDTPKHGVRPFEYVHIDHTLVDVELLCSRTGKSLGRPWLTLMIDAFSRRILAFHLGFHQPGRAEVLMCFRALVKRWNRIPFMTICDNGKDLIADDVQAMVKALDGHFRRRPKGQPRVGSVMERIFGTANTQLFHNLEGNTKLTKNVRMLSGSHLPERLANWSLEHLYAVIEHWAFSFYDNELHPALGLSPKEAFTKGLNETGHRPHKMIAFCDEFLIATCPSVDRGGKRKIDRQRGIKAQGFYYQSPDFDRLGLDAKSVPVRTDPNNVGRIFFQLPDRSWKEARSMQLAHLPRLNSRQLEAISQEYRVGHKVSAAQKEISGQRLVEFIATINPDSPLAKEIELSGLTEALQGRTGLLPSTNSAASDNPFGFGALKNAAISQVSGADAPKAKPYKRSLLNEEHVGTSNVDDLTSGYGTAGFQFGEL